MVDEKTQAAIDKAVARAVKDERKLVNSILADAKRGAGDLEDSGQKKAVKAALTDVSNAIKGV